ncbi:hypothetical protein [Streptosporangium sp. NPDC000396]|uniref:hypothetical protein n=1 Tax=Streptosporangium sp. NPDC000396 TaxID=3366185 RepID=UPI003689FE83
MTVEPFSRRAVQSPDRRIAGFLCCLAARFPGRPDVQLLCRLAAHLGRTIDRLSDCLKAEPPPGRLTAQLADLPAVGFECWIAPIAAIPMSTATAPARTMLT